MNGDCLNSDSWTNALGGLNPDNYLITAAPITFPTIADLTLKFRVGTFQVSGLYIDDQFKWNEHVNHVKSKLSKSLYVLRTIKNIIGQTHMLTLYNTLSFPYLTYGLLLWGGASNALLKKINVLQKKHIRVINNLGFNAHTLPYFHSCNILKLTDLYSVELSAFMFLLTKRVLPNPIIEIFKFNNQVHNTIQANGYATCSNK